ncbi:hypothetical protein LTR99_002913 [Exophiala xenobiotica]|nr:hypothetical protein LTR92_005654 [Exophiala xenobiotica]KAK5235624.1 hypothetical protein LTR47_003097 [Exophiala xenobiotica]KAK5248517.1 hypothetical protein LTS06_006465 [Exophiala xenobiotica]KAK5259403.1 hypothetical protein LTR40_006052 [Exophiala xenobiotica]KAK5305371.1 hypothetical protein LTR99_002913 [Exophiala xenobiotica]
MQRRPSLVPDLFHIKRTTVLESPPSVRTEVCGTYTSLESAQAAALQRLQNEGYSRSSWEEYAENDLTAEASSSWQYPASVVVHARKNGEVHDIEIESTPNSLGVRARAGDGRVEDQLFYVLCTIESEDGSVNSDIRSIHLSKQAAVTAALGELVSGERNKNWYREYKEVASVNPRDEDAEGPEMVVSAVGQDGGKYVVSVTHES